MKVLGIILTVFSTLLLAGGVSQACTLNSLHQRPELSNLSGGLARSGLVSASGLACLRKKR